MQLTEFKDIEKYIDNLLSLPIFADTGKIDELKKFLTDQLYTLYEENPTDVINLFNRSFDINPVSLAFTMSLGILEQDVETAISYFITDVVKLLYQKSNFKNLSYLKTLLQRFGLTINVYRVIVKNASSYVGEEVETGEIINLSNEEFVDNKHLLALNDYQVNLKQDQYETIVVKIKIENTLYFDKYTYSPPPILQAYAFTKYYDSDMQFFMSTPPAYSHNIHIFFKTLRYLYLKFIQFNNPTFDIGNDPTDNYWYMIHESADLDAMHELCEYYFFNLDSRENFEYYVRAERLLLNEVTADKGHSSISDLRAELYNIDHNIVDEIDNYTDEKQFTDAFVNMRTSILIKINNSNRTDKIDELALMVFLYLVNVILVATETLKKQISELVSVYVKYFLPIYTDVTKEFDFVYKIGDRYNKIYIDDLINTYYNVGMWSLVDLSDIQKIEPNISKMDLITLIDSFKIGYKFHDDTLTATRDDPKIIISETTSGLINPQDNQDLRAVINPKYQFDFSDEMIAYVTMPYISVNLTELYDVVSPVSQVSTLYKLRFSDKQEYYVTQTNDDYFETTDYMKADVALSFENIKIFSNDETITSTSAVFEEEESIKSGDNLTTKTSSNVESDEIQYLGDEWQFTIYNEDGSEKETVTSSD